MKLGGCEVVLKSKGKVVREVDTTLYEDDETIISCYVPSKPGEKFLIEYSRNLDYGPLNTELSVDVYFGGIPDFPGWIAPDPAPRAKKVTGKILGSRRGGSLHKYMFSEPELIDGETPSFTEPDLIGAIEVQLGFLVKSEQIAEAPEQFHLDLGPFKVNEKDKKPGVHCAGPVLGEASEEFVEPLIRSGAKEGDTLRFIFLCRAEEWLEAEGLIRKRRRRRGELEPVEGQEKKPPQKNEPLEGLKMEVGGSVPKIKEEVEEIKVSKLNEVQTVKKELGEPEERIPKLKRKRGEVSGGDSYLQGPKDRKRDEITSSQDQDRERIDEATANP